MRRARACMAAMAVVAAVGGLAGCSASVSVGGGDPTLTSDEIESAISTQYAERNAGITLVEFTCDEAKAEVGTPIACRGRNSREIELEITGEITEVDTDEKTARYNWAISRAFAPGAYYERAARDLLNERADVQVATVRCPVRIELVTGARVDCEVSTADDRTLPLALELTNVDGGFRIL